MITRRSLLALSGLAGLGAAPLLLPAPPARAATVGTLLPTPTGPLPVGTTSLHLVDRARRDPLAPDRRPRELMVQLWYPARRSAGRPRAAYTTDRVASALEATLPLTPGTLASVRPHARLGAPAAPGPLPLLLLGHGRQGGRSNCTALAEDLASHGYLVAGLDHTYDARVVEFPDGRAVPGVLPDEPADWDAQERLEIGVRVGDLRFVASALTGRPGGRPSPARGPALPEADPRRIGVLGHSMGGAAAAEALRVDRRFRAGLGLDGAFFGSPVADVGLDRPYLLLTAPADHDTWRRWREHPRGWARHLGLAGTGHLSFVDLPHFAVAGGLDGVWPPELYAELLGTSAPGRTCEVLRTYARSFFDRALRGLPAPLLDAPDARYPEVSFRWAHDGPGL
ncbi:alpha/beta hydrolase [Streptomyces sp. NPDC048606]|uniref:alpha/beta hydrolase n=1 Tax=Streptomyces sp. NPDC048606 TaxID=3154726 RepID=UPI0034260F08